MQSNYSWVAFLKDKKGITVTNDIQKKTSLSKPNKIWVDKGSEFCNRSMKSSLPDNDVKCIQHIMKENLLLLKNLLNH